MAVVYGVVSYWWAVAVNCPFRVNIIYQRLLSTGLAAENGLW